MSRYLRRVLARSAGQPPGSLRAAPPRRWASQVADPFAAADPGAPAGVAPAAAQDRSLGDARPAVAAAPPRLGAGAIGEGGGALEARRGVDPVRPLLAPPPGRRGALGRRREPEPPAAAPSTGARPAVRDEPIAVARRGMASAPSVAAAPSAEPPATPAAMPVPIPEPAGAAPGRRDEPSRVSMPPPPATRREPTAATEPATPRREEPAAGAPRGATFAVATPPARPGPPPAPATPRPEIVIGRISVLVETARPQAPAPRVIQRVTSAPRGGDDGGGGLSHHFGRFGLGQL